MGTFINVMLSIYDKASRPPKNKIKCIYIIEYTFQWIVGVHQNQI